MRQRWDRPLWVKFGDVSIIQYYCDIFTLDYRISGTNLPNIYRKYRHTVSNYRAALLHVYLTTCCLVVNTKNHSYITFIIMFRTVFFRKLASYGCYESHF